MKVFSFNGVDFSTQKAFCDAFPAFRSYSAEVARGEVKSVIEVENLIAQRKRNHSAAVKANARKVNRTEFGKRRNG